MEIVSCVVPAAGRSSRMGEWKPLLPFRESTIIQTVVQVAVTACGRVIIVAGYRGKELSALFDGQPGVTVAVNPDWEMGMFASIRVGAGKVDTQRFFVVLGDMPFIRPEVYGVLLQASAADAVFPVFDGRRGHPVLLGPLVREAVLAADPRTGSMPTIISRFSVREMAWSDDSILRDIDTPEQLDTLR
jgi:molybdenum cofactor cytidylyltransferase